jgi:hypothetical protein
MKNRIVASKGLTLKEIQEAVMTLRKNERKPIWKLTREFPFIKRFYVFRLEDLKAGKSIDWKVRETLKLKK